MGHRLAFSTRILSGVNIFSNRDVSTHSFPIVQLPTPWERPGPHGRDPIFEVPEVTLLTGRPEKQEAAGA